MQIKKQSYFPTFINGIYTTTLKKNKTKQQNRTHIIVQDNNNNLQSIERKEREINKSEKNESK